MGIVLVVIVLGMGLRMGVIIGTALIATVLASFMLMVVLGIDLQRMSLGALVIALSMMVDDAIVVADGVAARLRQGMDRTKPAIEAAAHAQPAGPLPGATVIAMMAFYPIFASVADSGEYCRTLFTVVAIGLLASWGISMTITPLQCVDILPAPIPTPAPSSATIGGFWRRPSASVFSASPAWWRFWSSPSSASETSSSSSSPSHP